MVFAEVEKIGSLQNAFQSVIDKNAILGLCNKYVTCFRYDTNFLSKKTLAIVEFRLCPVLPLKRYILRNK